MIVSDHIIFNDDNTAWIVFDAHTNFPPTLGELKWVSFDCPCDICDGRGVLEVTPMAWQMHDDIEDCTACFNGRYAFDITVQRYKQYVPAYSALHFRVSIVPGMVLPIVDNWLKEESFIVPFSRGYMLHLASEHTAEMIDLPPATNVGMWAVKIQFNNTSTIQDF